MCLTLGGAAFEEVGLWALGRVGAGRVDLGDPPTKTAARF